MKAVQFLTTSLKAAVYGTLLSEEILKILLHRVPDMSPATVKGFRRHRIQGRVYPAIIPAEGGAEVQGMVRATAADIALPLPVSAESSRLWSCPCRSSLGSVSQSLLCWTVRAPLQCAMAG